MRASLSLTALIGLTILLDLGPEWPQALAAKSAPKANSGNEATQKSKPGMDFSHAYNDYVTRLQSKIFDKWDASEVTGKNRVVLEAFVDKDGSVTQVNLSSTPNNPAAEEAAHQAFNQIQPLEVLPAGSPPARIVLTFDSTFDPHGDSSSNMQARMYPQAQGRPADNK